MSNYATGWLIFSMFTLVFLSGPFIGIYLLVGWVWDLVATFLRAYCGGVNHGL